MKYLFSIVIPTLNEERYLPRLLEDLRRQYEKNFEVIVVDAHSVDKTKHVALSFRDTLPLQCITSAKQHLAFQRNFGAKKATGKYLIFLDADCELYPSFTKRLAASIKRKGGLLFLPSLVPDKNTSKNKLIFSIVNAVVEASQSIGKPLPTASALFIEKNFFRAMKGYSESTYATEDHDLMLRAKRWGVQAKFLKDVKVIFSLRRVRKEGEWKLLSKYFMSASLMFLNGKVKDGAFPYDMGGHIFASDEIESVGSRGIGPRTSFLSGTRSNR